MVTCNLFHKQLTAPCGAKSAPGVSPRGLRCADTNFTVKALKMRRLFGLFLVLSVSMIGHTPSVDGQFGWSNPTPTFTNAVITVASVGPAPAVVGPGLTSPKGTINGYTGSVCFGTTGTDGDYYEGSANSLLDGNVPGTWYVIAINGNAPWVVSPVVGGTRTADHILFWRRYGTTYATKTGHTVTP
jgi:hypothetical protein